MLPNYKDSLNEVLIYKRSLYLRSEWHNTEYKDILNEVLIYKRSLCLREWYNTEI